jgi:hypothetical protein
MQLHGALLYFEGSDTTDTLARNNLQALPDRFADLSLSDSLQTLAVLLVESIAEVDAVDEVEAAIARAAAKQFGVDQIEDDLAKVTGTAHTPAIEHNCCHRAKLISRVFLDPYEQLAATDMTILARQLVTAKVRHRVVECVEYKVIHLTREPTVPATNELDLVF